MSGGHRNPARIVSLLPGATETVCAMGLGGRLVGRSHECDFPAEVLSLPVCTAPNVETTASSAEIDRQVQSLLLQSVPLCRLDAATLRELQPDVILTQAECGVDAVSAVEVERAINDWPGNRPEILSIFPRRMTEVWDEIRRVALALGAEEPGRELLRSLKNRCVDVIEKVCVVKRRPTVVCLEWLDPLKVAGHWMPDLVELAAGGNLLGEPGKPATRLDWEALRERDPEVLVIMARGFDISRTLRELPVLTRQPGWLGLRAVKQHRLYVTDGSHYFNRPGPRMVESLEMLAELTHPNCFTARHRGTGWEQI